MGEKSTVMKFDFLRNIADIASQYKHWQCMRENDINTTK